MPQKNGYVSRDSCLWKNQGVLVECCDCKEDHKRNLHWECTSRVDQAKEAIWIGKAARPFAASRTSHVWTWATPCHQELAPICANYTDHCKRTDEVMQFYANFMKSCLDLSWPVCQPSTALHAGWCLRSQHQIWASFHKMIAAWCSSRDTSWIVPNLAFNLSSSNRDKGSPTCWASISSSKGPWSSAVTNTTHYSEGTCSQTEPWDVCKSWSFFIACSTTCRQLAAPHPNHSLFQTQRNVPKFRTPLLITNDGVDHVLAYAGCRVWHYKIWGIAHRWSLHILCACFPWEWIQIQSAKSKFSLSRPLLESRKSYRIIWNPGVDN